MPRSFLLFLFAFSHWLPSGAQAGVLDWLFPKHDVQVITVTDTTPAGALRRRASAVNPVYYIAVNAGYREVGGMVAGEKVPVKEEVLKTMAKVLGKQGYLPATAEHPASLLMLWTWGTMNTDRMFMGGDDTEGRQVNRRQLLRFMGAYKLGLISKEGSALQDELSSAGMMFKDAPSELISDMASEDLYIAAIAAYDHAAAVRGQKELLWTTKISCPSRGLSLPETLPVMLALAGPNIGRETLRPVVVTATEKFKTEVSIGDPTVVEYLEKNPLPLVDAPVPDLKKSTPAKAKSR